MSTNSKSPRKVLQVAPGPKLGARIYQWQCRAPQHEASCFRVPKVLGAEGGG